jgi:ankyrin repeat protein
MQADIDAFVDSAFNGTLTHDDVTATAVATNSFLVNGRHSSDGWTALHYTVVWKRIELVVALLAAGADATIKNDCGETPAWYGALYSTADILQLLIDGGGSVNEPNCYGQAPLIALVRYNIKEGDAAARLQVLLAFPELDLDAKYNGKTAEEWAVHCGRTQLAVTISAERARRQRWSALRAAWVAATIAPTSSAYCFLSPMGD